jgi:hypothetical protein
LDVALAAALDNGALALKGASARLKNHRELVLAACATRGKALQYASLALRSDRAVVLCAVRQDGTALQFASLELRGDGDVVRRARANSNDAALQFATAQARPAHPRPKLLV